MVTKNEAAQSVRDCTRINGSMVWAQWIDGELDLLNNYEIALSRLGATKKRLVKSPEMTESFVDTI
jgi:hypothetical protein